MLSRRKSTPLSFPLRVSRSGSTYSLHISPDQEGACHARSLARYDFCSFTSSLLGSISEQHYYHIEARFHSVGIAPPPIIMELEEENFKK